MKSFIIQARLGSSRLPNKIVLPFYHKSTILDILIDKLKNFPQCDIILATSCNKENDLLLFTLKNTLEKREWSWLNQCGDSPRMEVVNLIPAPDIHIIYSKIHVLFIPSNRPRS